MSAAAKRSIEQTAVLVDVPHYERKVGIRQIWCTIDSDELTGEIVHVHFFHGWRATFEALQYPHEDWIEGYLEGLARLTYRRKVA